MTHHRPVSRHRLRASLLTVVTLLALGPRPAAAQADTLGSPLPLFTYRDLVLAGSVAVVTMLARPFDDAMATRLQDSATQDSRKLQKLATFVRTTASPGAYYIGGAMYLGGRISGNEKMADLGLHGTEALLVGELVAVVVKGTVGRQRPSEMPRNSGSYELFRGFRKGESFRSFPSGHSTSAFAAAAAVTSETSRWWPDSRWIIGPVLYGGAALVGVSRMYNNRHWLSDVLIGAGVGTFAGLKVVRYQHTHPGNAVDKLMLVGSLVPTSDGHALRWSIMPVPRAFTRTGTER
jgi:membrane-associated phospholipid phosphatase